MPFLAVEASSTLSQLAGLVAIIVAARIASELAERIRQPGVLAEIAAGIVLGPSALGLVEPTETIHLLGEVGAILLLFEVGLHMDLGDLKRVGADAGRVGIIGVVAPGLAIWAIASAFGIDPDAAIFLGAAATATSVGITARVFADMKVLATVEARTVLGAAVADDVLGLLILTFVTQTVGDSGGRSIELTIALAIGFIVIGGAIAIGIAPRFFEWAARHGRTEGSLVVATLSFALAIATLGAWAGLAPLIGAFIAGIAAARSDRSAEFQRRISPVGQLIIPIFFVSVGLSVDVGAFADPSALLLAAVLTAAAIVTKILAGLGMRRGKGDRLLVGLGMVPRGEVGLIFAALGLSAGVLNERNHASLILVMLLTTIVTPPLLRLRLQRTAQRTAADPDADAAEVRIQGGTVSLAGTPEDSSALATALQLARAAGEHRTDPDVTTWLRQDPIGVATWDDDSRSELFRMLRAGRDRSFRLLENTGAFARIFPSIAAEARHAVDPYGLEGEATWEPVLELQSLLRDPGDPATEAFERISDSHLLLLAALARGAFQGPDDAVKARDLAASIGLPWPQAEEVGELVGERRLLMAAALEPDLGDREQLQALVTHLNSARKATALYVLAVAEQRRDRETRARLDALHDLLLAEFASSDTGEAPDRLEAVRRDVIKIAGGLPDEHVLEHLAQASRRYLLTTSPETILRHVRMAHPEPDPDEVRVELEELDDRSMRIHFVFRDRHGALAALAFACTNLQLPIRDASAARWSNGLGISTVIVQPPEGGIDLEVLRTAATTSLLNAGAMESLGRVDGHLSIDNHASPWHSVVEVRATDRDGLLANVAAAISANGGEILSARVTTVDGTAHHRFSVQGSDGGKLSGSDERALRHTLATGTHSGRTPTP